MNKIFLTFIFSTILLLEFDTYILWDRSFSYDDVPMKNYINFFAMIIVSWLMSFVFFKKIVKKYSIKKMLPISLLLASYVSWTQYKYSINMIPMLNSQREVPDFSILIFMFNFCMGYLIACLSFIIKDTNLLPQIKINIMPIFTTLMAALFLPFYFKDNLSDYFVATCLFYFIFFIISLFNSFYNFKLFNKKDFICCCILSLMFIFSLLYTIDFIGNKRLENLNLPIIPILLICTIIYKGYTIVLNRKEKEN